MTGAITALLLYCRAGFEDECAKEIAAIAAGSSIPGFIRSKPGAGSVEFVVRDAAAGAALRSRVQFRELIFTRQMVFACAWVRELPVGDRVGALLPAVAAMGLRFGALLLETADTDEAKALSSFLRPFRKPFEAALRAARLLDESDPGLPRLHVFFTGSAAACVGFTDPANSSPWPMGIHRMAVPREAPSRSTLKLAEALQWFLSREEERQLLHEGTTAVDLGAAPGGWTWQLVRRGVQVTAVDNGPMDPALLASGQVDHARTDGFAFRPRAAVEWMVCDIVEQPIRVARLVAAWLAERRCQRTIFNLKLPMKKRYDEVARCRRAMEEQWAAVGVRCELRFRHLYHDREEITGYALRIDDARKKPRRPRD